MISDKILEIVDTMDLEEGHTLTEEEAFALHDVYREALELRSIRRALGLIDN